jgi:WD40 repeat protein
LGFAISRIRKIDVAGQLIDVKFLGDVAAFVLSEESLLLVSPEGTEKRVVVHEGAILSVSAFANEIVTGGDDGRVVALTSSGQCRIAAVDSKKRWIDCVTVGSANRLAWSAGKQVFLKTGENETRSIDLPSTVAGLAFGAAAELLAVAHYNAVTLWRLDNIAAPDRFEWKGSHAGVTFSPTGNFVVTKMKEPALHGWRLQDRKEIPMHGYAARVQSTDWTPGGKWLATSGSQYLVLWPFEQSENPLSTVPLLLAGYRVMATVVSCHPHEEVVAVGYADGLVLLIRIEDEAEILLKSPRASPVSSIAWNANGTILAIACADGTGRIIDFAG